jgi:hypothetical protein
MPRPPRPRARGRGRAEHTALRWRLFRAATLALLLALPAASARAQAQRAEPARWTPALEAEAARLEAALAQLPVANDGSLRVRLAFGAGGDLDLYVTDPRDETIYFANERAAAGGRLVADARCDSPSPRIEEVAFTAPLPGRYRVGIDYMVYREACGEQPRVMAYVIAIDSPSGRRLERGLARRGIFDAKKLELATGDVPTSR